MRANVNTLQLLEAVVRGNFHAQMAFESVVAFLQRSGLLRMLSFDRDSQWVGSVSARYFPSALWRFLQCVGISPNVVPP
jgi:hypothetical protein